MKKAILLLIVLMAACSPAVMVDPAPVQTEPTAEPVTYIPIPADKPLETVLQEQGMTPMPASLPAMTAEECAAAGVAAGWSATWGPASDGCWIISPDGSQTKHLGTWKE